MCNFVPILNHEIANYLIEFLKYLFFNIFLPFFPQSEMSLDSPGVYNLHIKLPQKIDPERTDATFNTNSHKLIVKLPIQS